MTIKQALINAWETQDPDAFTRVCDDLRFNHNYTYQRTLALLKRHCPDATLSSFDALLEESD